MKLKEIEIVEVGPRDGFQNLKDFIPTEKKVQIIDRLVGAGIRDIQITSFVHPKAIPQLRDAAQVTEICLKKNPSLKLFALIPNLYGAAIAWNLGLRRANYVISLSESHNKANINRTHEQSFEELDRILEAYSEMDICIDVATAFGCPFEGIMPLSRLMHFLEMIYERGIRSICLCDTIGIANPTQVRDVVHQALICFPGCEFQVHIHDTRGMGLVNTLAVIECGIIKVQSTIGGLGGCPFAPGASGNTATEDLVYMLEKMGYQTGVKFSDLLSLAKDMQQIIVGNYSGHHLRV